MGLETVGILVPEHALDAFTAAFDMACSATSFFLHDESARVWRLEGVKPVGRGDAEFATALIVAALVTGLDAPSLERRPTEAGGWLARTRSAFPEQRVGRRFAIRGTHLPPGHAAGCITLVLDAGVAFGSGEHASTRGCLRALEQIAHRRPVRVLDLGCGSGILAMAAARLLHCRVLATDIDRLSVRVARHNAVLNGLRNRVRVRVAAGWQPPARSGAPYDLVFANILARPLCAMAGSLATALVPGGTAILSGLLARQARMVLAAHRRAGLTLDSALQDGTWTTLVLRKPGGRWTAGPG